MKKNEEDKTKEINDIQRLDEMNSCYYNLENEVEGGRFHYTFYNQLVQLTFMKRVKEIINEDDLNTLKNRIDNNSGDQGDIKEEINSIILEYKKIIYESEEDYQFNLQLLSVLLTKYENTWGVDGLSEIYKKICADLVNRSIKARIQYEKKIIYIKDKLKEINIKI